MTKQEKKEYITAKNKEIKKVIEFLQKEFDESETFAEREAILDLMDGVGVYRE